MFLIVILVVALIAIKILKKRWDLEEPEDEFDFTEKEYAEYGVRKPITKYIFDDLWSNMVYDYRKEKLKDELRKRKQKHPEEETDAEEKTETDDAGEE